MTTLSPNYRGPALYGDKWVTIVGYVGLQNGREHFRTSNGLGDLPADELSITLAPPLPGGIPLTGYRNEFITKYVNYSASLSPMTPALFHESAALWLGSVAIARRIKVAMGYADVYPNLYQLWAADTTLYRKTTALDFARKKARHIMPYLLNSQDSTPEALLSDLAGREPAHFDQLSQVDQDLWKKGRDFAAQKGWSLDEISSLLANAGKEYNAGLIETLLRLYDCDERFTRSTRTQGLIIIKDSYLSVLGASTPKALQPHLNNSLLWDNGFWPRFAILTPEKQPEWKEPKNNYGGEPPEIEEALNKLLTRLPKATWPDTPDALSVKLDPAARLTWQGYNKAVGYDLIVSGNLDNRLFGTYGRLPTQVIKIATIMAALDWPDNQPEPTIEESHMACAINIAEKWRESTHRALEIANQKDSNALQERVIKQISKHMQTGGATYRDLYKAMKDKSSSEIENCVKELIKLGTVDVVSYQNANGGRPTAKLKLI